MSGLGPLDFQRMAALTMSGFESSEAALHAVVEHVDALCSDIIERHEARLEGVLSGRDISDLVGEERLSAQIAWGELRNSEQMKISIARTLGIYTGILLRSNPTQEETETALFFLAKLVDDLVQVGATYMVGRTKEEIPPSITASDFASNGGKKRAAKAAEERRPAKERFSQICADLMSEDKTRLASQLIKAAKKVWGEATPTLPEDKQLSTWLAEAVEAGTVPEPRTDRRSKKVRKSTG